MDKLIQLITMDIALLASVYVALFAFSTLISLLSLSALTPVLLYNQEQIFKRAKHLKLLD
jgi:hypothetical protein